MDEALIHDYLDGNLKEEALQEFEKSLQEDEAFASRVDEYRQLRKMLPQALAFDQQKAQVRAVLQESTDVSKAPNRLRLYAIAAGLLVLFSALLFTFWPKDSCQKALASELFAEQETPGFVTTSMSAAGPQTGAYEQALLAFIQKDFVTADSIFQLVQASDSIFVEARILSGIIALKNKDYPKAEGFLVVAQKSSPDDIHTKWYLALTYAIQCKNEKAKPLLRQVLKSQKGYHLRASRLLDEL